LALLAIGAAITFSIFEFDILPYPRVPFLCPVKSVKPYLIGWLLSWEMNVRFLQEMYSWIILYSIPVYCIFALLDDRKEPATTVSLLLLLLIAYFSPIYSNIRFLTYMNIFMVLSFSYLVLKISKILLKGASLGLQRRCSMSKALLPGIGGVFCFLILIGATICAHAVANLNRATLNRSMQEWMVFRVGKFLRTHVHGDNPFVLTAHGSGLDWFNLASAFYANVGVTGLWKDDMPQHDLLLNDVYLAETSKDAYYAIQRILQEKEFFVMGRDPYGEEIKRAYQKPSDIILLYNDKLACWLGDPSSPLKFFDVRYFEPLLIIEQRIEGFNYYIFRVKPEPDLSYLQYEFRFEHWNNTTQAPALFILLNPSPTWTGTLDNKDKIEGLYSYRIEIKSCEGNAVVASKPLRVTSASSYLIKFWAKARNIKYLNVYLAYFNETAHCWETAGDIWLSYDHIPLRWKAYYVLATIPANVTEVTLVLNVGGALNANNGSGVAWFDHIEFIGPIRLNYMLVDSYEEMGLSLNPSLKSLFMEVAIILPLMLVGIDIVRRRKVN